MNVCRACHARIEWVVTAAGKSMPLDPTPVPDGNIVKTGMERLGRGAFVPEVRYVVKSEAVAGDRYVSHFATCPAAGEFRKPKAAR